MKKISSVELLRFISAMMVLIWHYQQFYLPYNFFSDIEIIASNRDHQPFYNYLSLFYNYGNRGVDFFFIISGYVFAYVYLTNGKIFFKKFFINRLARLYPLHILTLFVVAILQFYNVENFDNYLIYFFNDLYHFFLNLFFISGWGIEKGPSFNGPIWSVSVEIIIYFLFFFLIIKTNTNRILKSIFTLAILLSVLKIFDGSLSKYLNFEVINCGILFFEGVLIYYLTNKFNKKTLFFIAVTLFSLSIIGNFKLYVFLPSIILFFLSLEGFIKKKMSGIFCFLGNLTYGTYLWHVPTQIILIIFIKNFGLNFSIIDTKLFFLIYLSFVFIMAIISYYFFEKKARNWLREKFT